MTPRPEGGRSGDAHAEHGIIVSLTSYPARIAAIGDCLVSLLAQSLAPERVVLWLGVEEFPNKEADLPKSVLELRGRGLEIRWTTDIKSYKKLIPALREFPGKVIVTADDDAVYPANWLEALYGDYRKAGFAKKIYAHRVHHITFTEQGRISPYIYWIHSRENPVKDSYLNVATGLGGILYPPECLHPDILNEDLFLKLAPRADDLFFWAMAVLNGTAVRLVDDRVLPVDMPQPQAEQASLGVYNVLRGGNDAQLEAILRHYPELRLKVAVAGKVELREMLSSLGDVSG